VEAPVGVFEQLLQPLVAMVQRMEEGHGVGGVDEDRQAQPARGVPQRPEAVVVREDERSPVVPHPQAEILPYLEAPGARRGGVFEAADEPIGKARTLRLPPVDVAEGREPAWV
jgi:hypothetical protein